MDQDALYKTLQREHEHTIRQRGLRPDPMWGQKCTAYNVQVLLEGDCQDVLAETQELVARDVGDWLLRIPKKAMHVSVTRLLEARRKYDRPKEDIWAEIGNECVDELRRIAAESVQFDITYGDLIVTSQAIIAVAKDDGQMERLREKIVERLPLPGGKTTAIGSMVHTTLFRYGAKMGQIDRLMNQVATVTLHEKMRVAELVVRKECIYPSLQSELLTTERLGQ